MNRFGITIVAGFGAGARLDQFAFMPAISMGLAVSALVGQNLGAGKEHRVVEIVRWSAILGGSTTALVSAVAIVKPDTLMRMFTSDEGTGARISRRTRVNGIILLHLVKGTPAIPPDAGIGSIRKTPK